VHDVVVWDTTGNEVASKSGRVNVQGYASSGMEDIYVEYYNAFF
jgi:hypothetical protein